MYNIPSRNLLFKTKKKMYCKFVPNYVTLKIKVNLVLPRSSVKCKVFDVYGFVIQKLHLVNKTNKKKALCKLNIYVFNFLSVLFLMPISLTFQFLFYVRYEATLYCQLNVMSYVKKSNQISESQSL